VTYDEKKGRAYEIADKLSDQGCWLTHRRSIKIKDLEKMHLKIYDYSAQKDLYDAITRYYTLLRMSFSSSGMFKIIETSETQIIYSRGGVKNHQNRAPNQDPVVAPNAVPIVRDSFIINVMCSNCGAAGAVQARLSESARILNPAMLFPANNIIICNCCGAEINLIDIRNTLESRLGQKIV
jgi:hypothetical protein